MTLKLHQRADYNPCEHEPCPCGGFYIETPIKLKKNRDRGFKYLLEVRKDILVREHDTKSLIICSTLNQKQVSSLIDSRWRIIDDETCPNHCLGLNVLHSRHYTFVLMPQPAMIIQPVAILKQGQKLTDPDIEINRGLS